MIPTFDEQVHWGRALPIFLALALLQAAQIPTPTLLGAHGDVLLVLTASWAVLRSPEEAMLAAPPAAFLIGMLGPGPIGSPLLALLAPIALALWVRRGDPNPRLPAVCIVAALSSLAAAGVDLTIQFLSGGRDLDLSGLGTVVFGAMMFNTLLAAAFYWPVSLGRQRKLLRRSRLSL